jgi:hypothetical protein
MPFLKLYGFMANRQLSNVKNEISLYEEQQKRKISDLALSGITYNQLLTRLENMIKQSSRMTQFNHSVHCFFADGVYQLSLAIEQVIGVTKAGKRTTPSGDELAMQTVDVQLADGTRVKVPFGKIELPGMGEDAYININYNHGTHELQITGECQYRFSSTIDKIFAATEYGLKTNSIYKDMAIEVDGNFKPRQLNLSNIDDQFMILPEVTEKSLRPLMARVLSPDKCRENGIELKTGVLLEGPYGTGKTLLAFKVAAQAIENNWSFIYLKDPQHLAEVLKLSKTLDENGNGVIVFLEDIDQVTRGNRDANMQEILNTLDGGDTKGMNVILICTTNHIELIEPTFLRGKRMGTIVSMTAFDAETIGKFVQHTFEGKNSPWILAPEGLEEVYQEMADFGVVPAFMAEICDGVKSQMLFEDDNVITAVHLQASFLAYKRQVELARTKDTSVTPEQAFYGAFQGMVKSASMGDKILKGVTNLEDALT